MTLFDLSVRVSFPGHVRSLADTGRAMAEWARAAAGVLAPELSWVSEVAESEEHEGGERWSTTHVVLISGYDATGTQLGRGEARLAAGVGSKAMGGNGLVELEMVRPARHLSADNHCSVTHWDLRASPVDAGQIDGLYRALERVLGRASELGGERRDPIARSAQILVSGAGAGDAALWMEDLASAGLACREETTPEGVTIVLEHGDLADLDALDRARLVLGEVLGEAGQDDWFERARAILVSLPESPGCSWTQIQVRTGEK